MQTFSPLTRTSYLPSLGCGGELERSQLFLPAGSLTQPLRVSGPHPSRGSSHPWLTDHSSTLIVHAHLCPTHYPWLPSPAALPQVASIPVAAISPVPTIFLGTTVPPLMNSSYRPHQTSYYNHRNDRVLYISASLHFTPQPSQSFKKISLPLSSMTKTSSAAEYKAHGLYYPVLSFSDVPPRL